MDSHLSTGEAVKVLWADGVAPRKRQVAPGVSNQRWPELTNMARATILEQSIRLQILEELIDKPIALYAKDLRSLYEQKVQEVSDVDGR